MDILNASKPAKILYFIEGAAPTAEDFEAAQAIGGNVVFRNALAVPNEPHSLEICDGVAGVVPPIYAEAFPDADEAVAQRAEELKALSSKTGDEPAPKPKGKGASKSAAKPAATGEAEDDKAPGATGTKPAWNPNPTK